jgi:anti-sigma B factor antagonist
VFVSAPEPFRCEVRDAGAGVVSLSPAGELDAATVPHVADALRDARTDALAVLILDLRGLTFMDSAGLHLILDTHAWAHQADVRVMVIPGSRADTTI